MPSPIHDRPSAQVSFDAPSTTILSRRRFLQTSAFVFAASHLRHAQALEADAGAAHTLGLVTDLHHADKPHSGSRYYRETLTKLSEAAELFQSQNIQSLVELGDFIDAADSVEQEREFLATVNQKFTSICPDRHYVLGNHCVHTLTKQEFLQDVGQTNSFYACQRGPWRLIVLDACFRTDGVPYGRKNFKWTDTSIPDAELDWLRGELRQDPRPTVVFAHQRLDVDNHYGIANQTAVREILEDSGQVRAVFQGHSHRNDITVINGIPYCTLVAMVEGSGLESSGYSVLRLFEDGSLRLDGFRKQTDRQWPTSR